MRWEIWDLGELEALQFALVRFYENWAANSGTLTACRMMVYYGCFEGSRRYEEDDDADDDKEAARVKVKAAPTIHT